LKRKRRRIKAKIIIIFLTTISLCSIYIQNKAQIKTKEGIIALYFCKRIILIVSQEPRAMISQNIPIGTPLLTRKTVVFARVAMRIHHRDKSIVYLKSLSLCLD
jgi:hypothetical protein